ncbi:MAG: hypothetical protein IT210_20575 [Armatimonadetes bacterium]|nr:hypothetical protein [Armatimonadota bacterium]
MRRKNRAGYGRQGVTLVEMNAVILVLVMMAALVMPNLVSLRRSRSVQDMKAAILRLPAEARNEARKSREAVRLRVEEDALVMERVPAEGDPVEVRRVRLEEGFLIENARIGQETLEPDSWEWQVYPDGSAEAGGLEFSESEGEENTSLLLSEEGKAQWISGELPETLEDRWPAGEIEQRG